MEKQKPDWWGWGYQSGPRIDNADRSATCCCSWVYIRVCASVVMCFSTVEAFFLFDSGLGGTVFSSLLLKLLQNATPPAFGYLCPSELCWTWRISDAFLGKGLVTVSKGLCGRNIFDTDCGLMEVPITAVIAMFSFRWRITWSSTGRKNSTSPFTLLWKDNSNLLQLGFYFCTSNRLVYGCSPDIMV